MTTPLAAQERATTERIVNLRRILGENWHHLTQDDLNTKFLAYIATLEQAQTDAIAQAVRAAEHETWIGRREHDVTTCDLCAQDAKAAEMDALRARPAEAGGQG